MPARTKINQIPYVIFQVTIRFFFILHCSSLSWHIIPLKFSSWKYILWTKRAHQCTIFQNFEHCNESSPNSYAICETTRSRLIQILHHCSVSWMITLLYFLSQTLILWTKRARRSEIYTLLSGWVKVHQIPLHHSSVSWEITLLYFFSWNCRWFG